MSIIIALLLLIFLLLFWKIIVKPILDSAGTFGRYVLQKSTETKSTAPESAPGKFCSHCGGQVGGTGSFCPQCGVKL